MKKNTKETKETKVETGISKESLKIAEALISGAKKVKEADLKEDGSVTLAVTTDDLKGILDKKRLYATTVDGINKDLATLGLEVGTGMGVTTVTVTKEKMENTTVKYSDLGKV